MESVQTKQNQFGEVDELGQKLKRYLCLLPEAQLVTLTILKDLLPFEEKRHVQDVNTIGGIAQYARTHSDFKLRWCIVLNLHLKDLVKELWEVEPETAKSAVQKVMDGLIEIIGTRAKMPSLKEKVFGIYDKLDLRSKLLIGIGGELEVMSGVNVNTFEAILDQYRLNCDELIEQAKKDSKLSEDRDLMYLYDIYDMACAVNQSD